MTLLRPPCLPPFKSQERPSIMRGGIPNHHWRLFGWHGVHVFASVRDEGGFTSGSLDTTMSVSRLLDAATSGSDYSFNVGYPTPAEAQSLVVALLAHLVESLGMDSAEYALEHIPVLRMDIFGDLSPPAIAPILKWFRRRPSVRKKQDRSSRIVLEEDYSISHPRSCPMRKNSDTYGAEPTRIYHRGPCVEKRVRKASRYRTTRDEEWDRVRERVDGVIRIEAEHGKERTGGCPMLSHMGRSAVTWHDRRDDENRMTLASAFDGKVWAAVLAERIVEFGLHRSAELRVAPNWFSLIKAVMKEGVRFNQAARYAAIVTAGPENARELLKDWKRIRREVEAKIGRVYMVDDKLDPSLSLDISSALWEAIDEMREPQELPNPEPHPGLYELLNEEEGDWEDAQEEDSEEVLNPFEEDWEDEELAEAGAKGWLSIAELVEGD